MTRPRHDPTRLRPLAAERQALVRHEDYWLTLHQPATEATHLVVTFGADLSVSQ